MELNLTGGSITGGREEEKSTADMVVDFATHGISSAALSSGISIANTGIALYNTFGGDAEKYDVSDVLSDIGANETADYYEQHQVGLDTLGFIVGSMVPGLAAIKGLRAGQKALSANARLSTGLRKALLPDDGIATIRASILKNGQGATAVLEAKKLQLIASGFHQQALEAAAFEGAALLTINQSPAISEGDLTYFEGITSNLGGAGVGLVFGTGLGGIFQAFALRGAAKNLLRESELLNKTNTKIITEGTSNNIIAGDAAVGETTSYLAAKSKRLADNFSTLDEGVRKDILATERQAREDLELLLLDMTKTKAFPKGNSITKDKLFKLIDNAPDSDAAITNLSGVTKYGEFAEEDIIFDVPVSTVDHMFRPEMTRWYAKYMGISFNAAKQETDNVRGMAFSNSINSKRVNGVHGAATTFDQGDWDNMFTWRHETGHTLLIEPVSKLSERSALGKRLVGEGEELSRMARPPQWARVDDIKLRQAAGEVIDVEDLKHLEYMESAQELFADAYAMISNPNFAEQLNPTENYKNLYRFMVGNKALASKLKRSKAPMNINTGQLFQGAVTPTAADLGGIELSQGFVDFGKKQRVALNTVYDTDKLSWQEASALMSVAKIRKDIVPDMSIDWLDIPRLTAAKAQKINIKTTKDGATLVYDNIDEALFAAKVELGSKLTTGSRLGKFPDATSEQLTHGQLARYLDTGEEFTKRVSGMRGLGSSVEGLQRGILDNQRDIPFWSLQDNIDPMTPTHAVLHTDRRAVQDGRRIAGMAETQQRIRLEREAIDTVVAGYFKSDFDNLVSSAYKTDVSFADDITSVDTTTGLVKSANAELLSGQSVAQHTGKQGEKILRTKATELDNTFNSVKVRAAADSDAVYEASVLDSTLRQQASGNEYQFIPRNLRDFAEEEGVEFLEQNLEVLSGQGLLGEFFKEGNHVWSQTIRKTLRKALITEMDNEELVEVAAGLSKLAKQEAHTIKSPVLGEFWRAKVKYNAEEIVPHKNSLGAVIGNKANLNPNALHPGIADTSKYKFHAIVVSKSKKIMGNNDSGMIVAHDANTLQQKIDAVASRYGDDVEIHTNKQVEKYKKAKSEYDTTLLFRDSMMDSSLRREGSFWDVSPEPNADIFNQYTRDMLRQHRVLIKGMTEAKYGEELGVLRKYAEGLDKFNSTAGSVKPVRNAYRDTENLLLNRRPEDTGTLWNQINTVTEDKISTALYTVKGAATRALVTGDWEKMNDTLKAYGMDEMYSDAAPLILNNIAAPEPLLRRMTAKINSVIGTMMLRMDFAHSLVNVASAPIMLNSEFNALIRVASKDRVQVFRDATSIVIPGSKHKVPNSGALMLQATKNYFSKPHLIKRYKQQGHISTVLDDINGAMSDFAGVAKLSDAKEADAMLTKVLNVITAPTDMSEEFVKFIAANMADMATDTLRVSGRIKQNTISTFVSRVHGNYTASQRPDLFQGWIGQTVGLFQTYQFNLMQSLFGNVAAGNKAAVTKMMGLQAGIFGAQSVPGFQLVNEYIGERSLENNDFYKVSGELVGDTMSNFLMYGAASSSTIPVTGDGIDLYSRGDLTPRTPILIPTSPSEVPAVSIVANFLNASINMFDKISDGAPMVGSALDALGHSGFNRPLQGIAQLLSGERTTRQGNLLATYQGIDVWNAATKVMGTKTLSEAVATSSFYRTAAYSTYRSQEINDLGEAYKQTLRSGSGDDDTYFNFMGEYASRGGKLDNFNSWTARQHTNATESQINQLRNANNSPEGRYLQEVMGADIDDYATDAQFIDN